MIEKLNKYKITKCDGNYINADNNTRIINTIVVKINEVIDAVNALVYEQDKNSDWYDGQTRAENVQEDTESGRENVLKETFVSIDEALNTATAKELDRTRKALDVAVDALKKIDDTRSVVKENLYASYGKSLNSGNVFCWTTPDEMHNTLKQINEIKGGKDEL